MQKSGFFNAILSNGVYDRKYNANDYSDNLAVVISNGVLRTVNDDLKVTANGMVLTVAAGRAWINGHYYLNDAPYSFAAVTAPTGGTRYDRVFLRLNTDVSARSIELVYRAGTASNTPVKPAPVREGNIYEIVLADVFVGTNATNLTVTDTRGNADLCGWVYSTSGDNSFFTSLDNNFEKWFSEKKDTLSSVTLFKRYTWRTVLSSASKTIVFDIPQFDVTTSFLEVYVNGLIVLGGYDFIINTNTRITFNNSLEAGTEIVIFAYKSVDGTGIMSVADEVTELQNAVATLANTNEYKYICNGVDDNIKLSEIAQAYLNGGIDYGSKTIKVYGTFGASTPFAGSGATADPYRWLSVGSDVQRNRRITLDFSNCSEIYLPITASTYNVVFYGNSAHIIGANVSMNQTAVDTVIHIFNAYAGAVLAENCRFWITAYRDSRVGQTGTFNNCRASVANVTNNSYCFLPFTDSLLRINGGEFYAYTGNSAAQSAVVGQSAANSVSILNGVNAPTLARSGFYQTNSVLQWAGGGVLSCTDLVSELPLIVVAGISNIRGTIAKSKAGAM